MPTALPATRSYQAAQVSLRALTYRDVARLWPLLDPQKLDASFVVFAAAVLKLIDQRRPASAALARSYLVDLRKGVQGTPPPVETPPTPRDAVLTSLRVVTVISIKSAMTAKVPLDRAVRNALVRTMGTVDKFVGDAGRETIRASVEADPAAKGWRRRTLGTCEFCSEQAAGNHMESGDADFPRHDHCGCTPEPAYEAAPAAPAFEEQFVTNILRDLAPHDHSVSIPYLRDLLKTDLPDLARANVTEALERLVTQQAEIAARVASGESITFKTAQEYRDWADAIWAGPEGYSDAELMALRDYTSGGYVNINGKLRRVKLPWGAASKDKAIQAIDSAIERAAAVPDNIITVRNTDLRAFGIKTKNWDPSDLIGKEFVEHGYMSTSVNRVGAMQGEVRLYINVPKGSKGIYVSGKGGKASQKIISSYGGGESELIMKRGSRLIVKSVKKSGNRWDVVCDLLQG